MINQLSIYLIYQSSNSVYTRYLFGKKFLPIFYCEQLRYPGSSQHLIYYFYSVYGKPEIASSGNSD